MVKKGLFGVSLLTMTCLYGMLAAVVFLICILCDIQLSLVVLISIIIFVLQFLLAPFFTDIVMKWFYKAKFDYQMPDYFKGFVEEVCATNNMKYPKIGYIDDGAPNAFTYGRTKNDARIVVTRGLFELLNEEEVKSVVAHELGHAVHYDMLFMTVAQLVPLILYYIYLTFTSNLDDDDNKLAIIGLIAYIFYVICQYVILWLSRVREYYADSFAVEVTKNPNALAEALVKIGYGLTTATTKEGKMSASRPNTLGIMDAKTSKSLIVSSYDDGKISKDNIKRAMRWEKWNIWAKWYEFFSTHPLISKRLEAISARSNEFDQNPYIVFDEVPTESYVDDFLFELLLIAIPTILLILAIVLVVMYLFLEKVMLLKVLMFFPAIALLFGLIKLNRTHKNKDYKETKVADLLAEVKVSGVTSVPCILEGEVIGRGDPGCIFNEDFVLKDETGIVFVDYKRVIGFMNIIDGLTKTKSLFGKKIRVKGWYRRSPVPYVEIYEMWEENGKHKKFCSYGLSKFFIILFLIMAIVIPIIYLV
ncbi:MAG: zinc metalloprotease HtpX [Mycoplasmatota bacterium]|nr:zinc metalloprotease HtpX [Mycoplasmatota bacterium]